MGIIKKIASKFVEIVVFVYIQTIIYFLSADKHYIRTFTGKKIHFLNIDASQIDIEDIAISLSRECRFGNFTSEFYSVAQHCTIGSFLVPREYALAFLLHDATEAYLGDIPRPLKILLPVYKKIEKDLEKAIFEKFNIDYTDLSPVKDVDMRLCITEAYRFMPYPEDHIPAGHKPYQELHIVPISPQDALQTYMNRFDDLQSRRSNN